MSLTLNEYLELARAEMDEDERAAADGECQWVELEPRERSPYYEVIARCSNPVAGVVVRMLSGYRTFECQQRLDWWVSDAHRNSLVRTIRLED